MLRKIDIYIIRRFLQSFFFAVLLFTFVAITVDFAENFQKFLNLEISAFQIFKQYYLNFIPWINGLLWPIFTLITVIFFTTRLARDSEFLAILNAGVSYHRLLVPYLVSAGIIASLHWLGTNYIIPHSNERKNNFDIEYLKKNKKKNLYSNIHFFISPDTKIYIRHYRQRDTSARTFRLEQFDSTGHLIYVLKAKRLKFNEEPNKWSVFDYTERKISEKAEELNVQLALRKDTILNFTPRDFVQYTQQMEIMPSPQLREYIQREESRGVDNTKKFYTELYRRSADPFSILILTIIGMSIASRKTRGGMGLQLAAGVVIASIFVVLSKFTTTFSTNMSLSPLVGMWLANIVFGIIAIVLVFRAQQ